MQESYVRNGGWSSTDKLAEMSQSDMLYFIRKEGFVSVQHTIDDGYECLYLYEIQIHKDHQKRGIGRQLLALVEKEAIEGLIKLTVFKDNTDAIRLYYSLGYELDSTDPSFFNIHDVNYHILSKRLN